MARYKTLLKHAQKNKIIHKKKNHHKNINLRMNYALYTSNKGKFVFADGVSPFIFLVSIHQN